MSFDAAYYRRFYGSPRTRVQGPREIAHLVRGVTEMIAWYGGEVRSVLDVGAGVGHWRAWFRANKRGVRYRSTEASAFACEKYGHERRDIARWRAREKFDLVVCQGVLPYLTDDDARKAIDNLGGMAAGFLYLEAITRRDLEEACDTKLTDVRVHKRTGAWYRRHLDAHFQALGCGLYYARRGSLVFYELESG